MKRLCPSALRALPFPFLFLLFFAVLWVSCKPTDDPPVDTEQYPLLFKYQKLDFHASKIYVLTATASNEIAPSGTYKFVDSYLQEELDIESWEFEIEKVELLDEARIRVSFFPALAIVPSDTVVAYKVVGNEVQFDFGGTQVEPYRYLWDKDKKALSLCLQTTQNSYFDAVSGETDYSSFHIENICDDGNPAAVIAAQRTRWNLQPGDTVLLNYSGWWYSEQ